MKASILWYLGDAKHLLRTTFAWLHSSITPILIFHQLTPWFGWSSLHLNKYNFKPVHSDSSHLHDSYDLESAVPEDFDESRQSPSKVGPSHFKEPLQVNSHVSST